MDPWDDCMSLPTNLPYKIKHLWIGKSIPVPWIRHRLSTFLAGFSLGIFDLKYSKSSSWEMGWAVLSDEQMSNWSWVEH